MCNKSYLFCKLYASLHMIYVKFAVSSRDKEKT